ncbi:MAG TPA: hypothetical protein VGA04_14035 [Streptosporangiaceae bacterium]
MPRPKPEPAPPEPGGIYCPGCGKPLADPERRLVHEGCPEDPRQWVTVPPPG